MKKKYNIKVNFNDLCFIQQSLNGRINHYDYKLISQPKNDLYLKAKKDLNKLLQRVSKIKSESNEKINVVVSSNYEGGK